MRIVYCIKQTQNAQNNKIHIQKAAKNLKKNIACSTLSFLCCIVNEAQSIIFLI